LTPCQHHNSLIDGEKDIVIAGYLLCYRDQNVALAQESTLKAIQADFLYQSVNQYALYITRGKIEDATIIALYGSRKNLPQAEINKIIERARSLKFDPALYEDGNPVESRIVIPFEIKKMLQPPKNTHTNDSG